MDHVKPRRLSEILGLTTQRIGQLSKAGVIPPSTQKGYPLDRSVRGYIEFIESRGNGKTTEQERWTRLKADLSELQLKRLEASLAPTADVYAAAFNKARTVRDALLNIPARVSSILSAETDPFKVETILSKEIRQGLEDLTGKKDARKSGKNL